MQPQIQFEATRGNGYTDPPTVQDTILLQVRLQLTLKIEDNTITNIPASLIGSQLPGGVTEWDRFRINKFEVWGPDVIANTSDSNILTFGIRSATGGTDGAAFSDNGTAGNARAHVVIKPSTLYKMTWWPSGAATPVALIEYSGVGGSANDVLVQVSIEARSGPGASFLKRGEATESSSVN
jgi:hypothetical protein